MEYDCVVWHYRSHWPWSLLTMIDLNLDVQLDSGKVRIVCDFLHSSPINAVERQQRLFLSFRVCNSLMFGYVSNRSWKVVVTLSLEQSAVPDSLTHMFKCPCLTGY